MSKNVLIKDIECVVPELSGNIAIYPFDKNTYLIHEKKHGLHVRVNSITMELLNAVDGKRTINEIGEIINLESVRGIRASDIYNTLYGILASNGIIKSDKKIASQRGDYLKLKFPIFKERHVAKISNILVFLFRPKYFTILFLAMFIFLAGTFIASLDWDNVYNSITPINLIYFYIISFFVTLVHELGHVTACRRFGASHGDIGFAFYLYSPVFYADVSDAWKLKSTQRIIIDMAGVYMEFMIASFFSIIYLLTLNPIFLIYALFIVLHTFSNLNPLFRYDAYWALSDFLNIPNLRIDSNKKFMHSVLWIFKKGKNPFKKGIDYFLFTYSFLSLSLLIVFLTTVLLVNSSSILYLPVNLFYFVKSIITGWNTFTFDTLKSELFKLIIPLSFYFIVLRLLFKDKSKWKDIFKY